MTLSGRVGQFFFFLGLVMLVIFVASDFAGEPRFNLFFWGTTCVVVGILLMRRGRLPQPPSGRFQFLRQSLRRDRKKGKGKKEGGGESGGSSNESEGTS